MGQKPGLDGQELARDITDKEGLAGEGPNQWPPKKTDDSYFGCLCLSTVTNFTCKHWWSFGD